MKYIILNNGIEMPIEGYGVFQIQDPKQCEQCVSDAIDVGYRLIDTAAAYFNEEAVGRAVKKSGISREELFITTKLWIQDTGYENTLKAFETSIKKLGFDYLDLYLIHQPFGDYYDSWRAMEKLQREGYIRAIGVCNFSQERLVDLCLNSEITPAINQIEIHPFHQQQSALNIMKEYQVQPEAWGPLSEGQKDIFNNKTLLKIGIKYGKSVAQVILRWQIQQGVVAIPKTVHKKRMKENINIWDFELSEQDMKVISSIDIGHSEIIDYNSTCTAKWLNRWKIHN
ncbi:aldo/keto reductase [Clostridium felsineum]|uniref:aldo/keto reductase n=1 Tax=Clostridium felsineum TaxID=36839 RepID=UPI00098C0607|nr:aldo/keto reductase [Clostridium felsineum]URZ16665.1 Glyoxal reductase [Clostridium felsineum DSM 794]